MRRSILALRNILRIMVLPMMLSCASGKGGKSSGVGQVGSTARFAIAGDFLYVLSKKNDSTMESIPGERLSPRPLAAEAILRAFDISNPPQPKPSGDTYVIPTAETLFVDSTQLYVGAQTGVEIYDISVPGRPIVQSRLNHFFACDPIVTEGSTAYVTLHGSPRCQGDVNMLKIIDIADSTNPTIVTTFPMHAPFGLAVREGIAYICDGPVGLRVLDVRLPTEIQDLRGVAEDICVDIILQNDRIITTGFTGINQYDIKTLPPKRLSTILLGESNS